jgi:hypothetical protein
MRMSCIRFPSVARMLKRHLDGLLNFVLFPITNAVAEDNFCQLPVADIEDMLFAGLNGRWLRALSREAERGGPDRARRTGGFLAGHGRKRSFDRTWPRRGDFANPDDSGIAYARGHRPGGGHWHRDISRHFPRPAESPAALFAQARW